MARFNPQKRSHAAVLRFAVRESSELYPNGKFILVLKAHPDSDLFRSFNITLNPFIIKDLRIKKANRA